MGSNENRSRWRFQYGILHLVGFCLGAGVVVHMNMPTSMNISLPRDFHTILAGKDDLKATIMRTPNTLEEFRIATYLYQGWPITFSEWLVAPGLYHGGTIRIMDTPPLEVLGRTFYISPLALLSDIVTGISVALLSGWFLGALSKTVVCRRS